MQSLDLTGMVFNRFTVICKDDNSKSKTKNIKYICKCDCGNIKSVFGFSLKNGDTKSCGCFSLDKKTKHGFYYTKEYGVWRNMIYRCNNINCKKYKLYGGRGIKVCDRWAISFENFINDIGFRPSNKHSLDRFPNKDGNYEPSNCRWADIYEQNSNTNRNIYYELNGEKKILSQYAKDWGVNYSAVHNHINNGESIEYIYNFYKNKKKKND